MEKCKRFNRLLSLVLAFVMVFSMLPMPRVHAAEDGTALYLKPNSNWLSDGARFAAYYWNDSGDNWLDMTDADADGYYEVTIPAGYSNLIFCRMNPGVTDNNWDNRWNQTSNLTVPTDGTNCYTVAEGAWSEGDGAWSVYTPSVVEPEEPTTEPEEPTTEPVVTGDTYVVAGVAELCGTAWDMANTANTMTANGDGTYTKVYTSVPVGQSYQFKVVKNGSEWIGDSSGNNVTFNVSAVCDVTITFNSADNSITVTGDGVNFEQTTSFDSIHVVGNGSGNWLNGAEWDTTANAMTETSTGVYEITFENVAAGSYEFKFAANGTWADNWGNDGSEAVVGQPTAANYNGQNIKLTVSYALADVTLKLDLSGYDYTAKTGATYAVTVVEVEEEPEEPTLDYYLYGYVNGADISANEEVYKFVDGKLTVSFAAADNYVFVKDSNGGTYMAEAYCTDTTVALAVGNTEKLYVPGNLELEFTLVVNEDGTLTLSYAEVTPKTTVTIHFLRPDAWGTGINAYVWTAAGALAGYSDYNTWPGKAVSENASHPGWYDFVAVTDEPTAFNFIFNDGGNKTADLATGDVTGDTELWVVGNDVLTEAPGQWSGDYDYTVYFHFLKPDSWQDTIHAYVWDAAGNTVLGAWPGTAAEADSVNSGWYNASVTMDENAAINFIFNDNNGKQTGDLATGTLDVTTHIWIVDGADQTTAPEGWVDPNMTVHVPGTFPGPSWDAASNRMDYYPNLGLYALTFEDVPAANYEFKIAINGSWTENYGAGGVRDGSNIAVTVPETMDVTVYYSPVTHIAVTDVTYKFTMAAVTGTGIAETALVDPGLTGIYSGTVYMAAGTYTDVVILEGDNKYVFDEIVLEEGKDVTFYLDPVTGIFYCDASAAPVDTASIYFSSQDNECKTPFGAVEEGEEVSFAIKTGSDITSAVLVIKGLDSYPMTAEETATGKTWSATTSIANMGEYDYYFVLSNGSSVVVYGDDDGFYGEGTVTDLTSVMPYDLVVYEAGFETPDWMKNAVIYQIFPDRFFDGDESNNRAQTWARGAVDYEYITDWYTLPENPEQEGMLTEEQYLSHGAHLGDGEWSNEIYGGDLKGITQRIDYLKALGVNVIYLNPVFWSISNHRYDAVDYTEIDPILGTLGDFEELVSVAEANGMHIILDGVFNHVSDDSIYFDRYYKFLPDAAEKYDGKVGAYPYWAYVYDTMAAEGITQAEAETKAKTYFSENYGITDYSYTQWFAVSSTTMAGSADTIGLRAGKEVYSYEGWWGYDSMPVIYSTNGSEYQTGNWAQEIISGSNSVNAYWIGKGMDGWRLDVANEVSDETWQNFRDSVKALNSEAVIIGEIWDDATKYLMGDMYDSVMNYLFRNASTAFAMGTGAEATAKALEKIRERYPEEAFYAMMNLVGSHDTTRLLSYLDGIGDDRADKTEAAAFPTYETTSQLAKDRQYLVSFLQFTYAGAPTVYYGDEIGMVGSDDPDDRRAFEWGKGNQELVEWYARLAAVRGSYTALRTGTVEPIDADNNSLLAYVRSDAEATLLVIANNSTSAQTYTLGYDAVDLVTGEAYTGTVPAMSGVILAAAENAKTITVNTAALAPAYDPAYIVAERSAEYHEHEWTDATCTAPKTCASCGETEGEALGHDYVDGVCSRCGDKVIVYVAQLESTGEKYETLQAALDAANLAFQNGTTAETVTLIGDTTECVSVTWKTSKVSITIDLNGHTVTGDGTGSVFYLNSSSGVSNVAHVFADSVGTGVVTGGVGFTNSTSNYGGAIYVNSAACLLTINGGTFSGNTAALGGAIDNRKSATVINGGTFTGNTATKCGGAINASNLTINGGVITGNTANGEVTETSTPRASAGGGGIYVTGSNSVLTISGGKVYGNTAVAWGDDIVYVNTNKSSTAALTLADAATMGADNVTGWYVDGLNGAYNNVSGRTERYSVNCTVEHTDLTMDSTETQRYAVALKAAVPAYTVTYTDGVEDVEVFADQVYNVWGGEATPAFDGTPARAGYVFEGWTPEVAETVTANVTYTATWSCAHVWTEATCTEPKTCSVCGETEGAALGHKDENADYICDVCGEDLCTEHTEEVIPGKAPTCTEPGLTEGVKCSVCGDILVAQEEIPALGHTYEDGVCTVCGEADPDYVKPLEGVIRIAGADRIETSLKLADQLKEALGVEKFEAVVVASGLNFPDALTGSYLAAVKNAPILLTAAGWEDKVNTYITENLAEGGTVYVLGGTAVVPEALLEGLTGVKRLAGENRFGTNLAILEEAGVNETQEILICTATGFADSLAASASGLPILLVHGSLTAEQKDFLEGTSKDFVIIGGEAAVSADLAAELDAIGDVERVGGENRYKTSVLVAQRFVAEPDAVILAYARNYPDGLCGGPLAYALNASLILTDNYDPSAADGYVDGISAGVVVGGEGLISDASAKAIFDLTADAQITAK